MELSSKYRYKAGTVQRQGRPSFELNLAYGGCLPEELMYITQRAENLSFLFFKDIFFSFFFLKIKKRNRGGGGTERPSQHGIELNDGVVLFFISSKKNFKKKFFLRFSARCVCRIYSREDGGGAAMEVAANPYKNNTKC